MDDNFGNCIASDCCYSHWVISALYDTWVTFNNDGWHVDDVVTFVSSKFRYFNFTKSQKLNDLISFWNSIYNLNQFILPTILYIFEENATTIMTTMTTESISTATKTLPITTSKAVSEIIGNWHRILKALMRGLIYFVLITWGSFEPWMVISWNHICQESFEKWWDFLGPGFRPTNF